MQKLIQNRTHHCGELTKKDIGKTVQLVGWLQGFRQLGSNLGFALLRDFFGVTQCLIKDSHLYNQIAKIQRESVLQINGIVAERESKNPNMHTGDIEIIPSKIQVLGVCKQELPFEIADSLNASEDTRLRYRFLDLRNPLVKDKLILRSKIIADIRNRMTEEGFLEITTPILTSSSPEGARDYIVPARSYPGQFYALPQAPQQFKQLLMASGFDKYFQIAPCFRDEDARADRSPGEFYQLDMEMSFATMDDVFAVIERVLPPIFKKFSSKTVSATPFTRIQYNKAMATYGSDKPDLRNPLQLVNVTSILQDCPMEALKDCTINAIEIALDKKTETITTRKYIDTLCDDIQKRYDNKPYWYKVDSNGELVGGIAKFATPNKKELSTVLQHKPNTLVMLVAHKDKNLSLKTAGILRNRLGEELGLIDKTKFEFCWIVDFPMYELNEETGEVGFSHNPFSMPQGGLETLQNTPPLQILAYQYDLVCNGVELSSGAVRNHDPDTMVRAFSIAGLSQEVVESKFPAMYNAFQYGAPPHAGIAPGVDRMVMLILDEPNIREVIAFPMNKKARDLLMNAPNFVSPKQLKEANIQSIIQ